MGLDRIPGGVVQIPAPNTVLDHGALTGLTDNDHTQYLLVTTAATTYSLLGHLHTGVYEPVFTSKTANTFYAAPNGAAGVPSFRALVAADVPILNQNTTGSAGSVAWLNVSGRPTALSQFSNDVPYVMSGGALGTPSSGILTNCTFPTLNQNTTGSSGSCTGNAVNITGTLAVAQGGTGTTAPSGTYTPAVADWSNVAASTAYTCQWVRLQNTVIVSGRVDIDPTASGTTQWTLTLPIASDLTATEQLGGSGMLIESQATREVSCEAEITGDKAIFRTVFTGTASARVTFMFMYRVL